MDHLQVSAVQGTTVSAFAECARAPRSRAQIPAATIRFKLGYFICPIKGCGTGRPSGTDAGIPSLHYAPIVGNEVANTEARHWCGRGRARGFQTAAAAVQTRTTVRCRPTTAKRSQAAVPVRREPTVPSRSTFPLSRSPSRRRRWAWNCPRLAEFRPRTCARRPKYSPTHCWVRRETCRPSPCCWRSGRLSTSFFPPKEKEKAETSPSTVSWAAKIWFSIRLNCVAPVASLGVSSDDVKVSVPPAGPLPLICCQTNVTELAFAAFDAIAATARNSVAGSTAFVRDLGYALPVREPAPPKHAASFAEPAIASGGTVDNADLTVINDL